MAGVAFVAAPPAFGVALVAGTARVAGVAFAGAGGAAAIAANVAAANTAVVRIASSLPIFELLRFVESPGDQKA